MEACLDWRIKAAFGYVGGKDGNRRHVEMRLRRKAEQSTQDAVVILRNGFADPGL